MGGEADTWEACEVNASSSVYALELELKETPFFSFCSVGVKYKYRIGIHTLI